MRGKERGSGRCHADGAATTRGQSDYSTLTARERRMLWLAIAVSFAALLVANQIGVMGL